MGNIFAKKIEAKDELEKIAERVRTIDTNIEGLKNQQQYISKLFMLSVFVGVAAFTIDFMYKRPQNSAVLVFGFALVAYIITYFVFRVLLARFYFYRTSKQYHTKETLIKRKDQIMEEIKEKVNFNVARELILKYGNEEDIKEVDNVSKPKSSPTINGTETPLVPNKRAPKDTPPNTLPQPGNQDDAGKAMPFVTPRQFVNGTPRLPPMTRQLPADTPKSIRPFVGAARTPVDKLVDFVIGDGPNNRYALICKNCYTHNGMALPGEFERLAYYCYKCNSYNPSKQKRVASNNVRGTSADPGSAVNPSPFGRRSSDSLPEHTPNTLKRRPKVSEDNEEEEEIETTLSQDS